MKKTVIEKNMEKVLITGCSGLVGGSLMKILDATGIDRFDKIPEERFDFIIHCAANCVVREVINNPKLMMENINYTFEIMEKARRDKSKIILFSSSRVGSDENPYTSSKRFLEQVGEAYYNCYDVDFMIIRPETVWGRKELNKRVINLWIDNVINGKPCIVYGDEDKELPPIHISEFIEIFMYYFNNFDKHIGEIVSISGEGRKVGEIIQAIGKYYNREPRIFYEPAEMTQPQKVLKSTRTGRISFEEQLKLGEVE